MRLLHVGSGFRPLRQGGLVAYTEDLMHEQLRRGHEVTYFFAGRHYPLVGGPRLRRWLYEGVAMLEVVNSPLYDHGRQPELELGEPRLERMFARILAEARPDVVHVHELAGLPTSLLDVVREAGAPCVFTLQDYFPLCSTFKLLDHEGRVCLRREIGSDCAATVAARKVPPGVLTDVTLRHEILVRPLLRALDPHPPHARVSRLVRAVANRVPAPPPAPPDAYQRRREVNLERLNRVDLLIAMSDRVGEIYALLGVQPERLRTVQLTLGHIERLTPRTIAARTPVTFGALNVLSDDSKGARPLVDAARLVAAEAPGSFRLVVHGLVADHLRAEAEAVDAIELCGPYWPNQVDSLLDDIDVGLVPSIWEEAYGYVGVEFLAKGIPVIANAIGGMTDYTRDGETGWLNRSLSAEELARIMLEIVREPQQVTEHNAWILANRDSIVKTVAAHTDEMDAIYGELLGEREGAAA
ncbi:MAG TPA: glycosyltransferase [Thermoleophilaceae bacterium]